MGDRIVCAGVVAFRGEEVLLIRHGEKAKLLTGSYGFPAGRVELSEFPDVTAIREFKEESGLETIPVYLRELTVMDNTLQLKSGPKDFRFYPYLCVKYWGELRELREGTPEWVDRNSLDGLLLVSEDVKDIVEEAYLRSNSG